MLGEILQPNSARADNCKEKLDPSLLADQTRTTGGETQPATNRLLWATDQTKRDNTPPPCWLINISASQEILSMGPDTGQGKYHIKELI